MRERDLLKHVFESNRDLPDVVTVPPGDDLGAITLPSAVRSRFRTVGAGGQDAGPGPAGSVEEVLLGVDQVIDGRHVQLDLVGPVAVGRKAVCRALSDVAAMAARPLCSLGTAALPVGLEASVAAALFDAMRETAAEYGCPLVGGDVATVPAGPLVLTVTVLATPGPAGIVRRSGACVGDAVYVTGVIGGSLRPDHHGHHLSFTPRISEGLALAEALGADLHAAIDVSDGLGIDAGHLATLSDVTLELEADRLPCRDGMPWRKAVADGEDYELLVTTGAAVPDAIGSCPVTRIGRVVPRTTTSAVTIIDGDARIGIDALGWEHVG